MRRLFASILLLTMTISISGCTTAQLKFASEFNVVCGKVRVWEPGWQKRLAAELKALPKDHIFRQLAKDAVAARDAIRICRGEKI
jgi:hypothetical protein